ncbi:MAG: hypothetical protein HQK49_04625 [Oligoflexia bacterium]|nr:hypothetical protein [Oligoflexia bacterium]
MKSDSFGKYLTSPIEFSKQWFAHLAFVGIICTLILLYSDYNLATGSGNLCLILFLLANTYIPAKRLRFIYNFRNVEEFFQVFLYFHCIVNIFAFSLACVHAYLTNWVNIWLEITLLLMGWLTFGGFLLKFNYNSTIKRWIYFLHSQQIIFYIMLFALLKGHYVI